MAEVLRFIVVPLAIPIITAIVGGFSLMLKDYRKARNAEHRSKERLESAKLEVEFIRQWLQAKQLLGSLEDAGQAAQEWLDNCYKSVEGHELREAEVTRRPEVKMATLRRLLLIGALRSPMARFLRVLYWIFLLLFNLFITYALIEVFAGVKDAEYGVLAAFLFFGGPAFLFAVMSRGAENSYNSKVSAEESPLRWPTPDSPGSSGSAQKRPKGGR
ncbi:hypothetical protein [Streptomyces flavidovirens]